MNLLDKMITWGVWTLVLFVVPISVWASLNVVTRPETITIAVDLPKPRPVVTIYEFSPEEEITDWFPSEKNDVVWTDQDAAQYERLLIKIQEDRVTKDRRHTQNDLLCLAKNIYFEAKNQSTRGQIAVGLVTLNRVASLYYPNSVCEVIYQNKQFSWYWDGLPDRPKNPKAFNQALLYASALLEGEITDFTYGSDHYHADYVNPVWLAGNDVHVMVPIIQIEAHIFYRQELKVSNATL